MAPASAACAGPPYVTDDPEITDTGRWETYVYANGVSATGETTGETGVDANYGLGKDLQLDLVAPVAYAAGSGVAVSGGDLEVALKVRLLHQDRFGLDVAVYPRLLVPTSRLGAEHVNVFLPVWAEKDVGKWQVFGGGGYQINPGDGQRDFWSGGVAVTRDVTDRLNLGGEIYARTADSAGGRDFVGVNLGAVWRLAPHWSLTASGGPGLINRSTEGRYAFYLALKAEY